MPEKNKPVTQPKVKKEVINDLIADFKKHKDKIKFIVLK
jgi:hypothetical protein